MTFRYLAKWGIALLLLLVFWQWPATWWLRGDAEAAEQALAEAEAAAAAAAEALPSPAEVQALWDDADESLQTIVWRNHPETREPDPVWWGSFWETVWGQAPSTLKRCTHGDGTFNEGGEAPPGVLEGQANIQFEADPEEVREGEIGGVAVLRSVEWITKAADLRLDLRLLSANVNELGGGSAEFAFWVLEPVDTEEAPAAAQGPEEPDEEPAAPLRFRLPCSGRR